mmetsp:Transcript_27459/g.82423  ORF Transcript_27459/g.82423 Transcript_27459/m.82423 type:complete len:319 (-) Transcript_27459:87-1043(-)
MELHARPPHRSAAELVAAFERGEDRAALMYEARAFRGSNLADDSDDEFTDHGFPRALAARLLKDRAGRDIVISAHCGPDLNVADLAQDLADTGNVTVTVLFVFDEELVLVKANNGPDSPRESDVITCPRLTAVEERLVWAEEDTSDDDDDPPPVMTPTAGTYWWLSTGFHIERAAETMEPILELFDDPRRARGLVAWSGAIELDARVMGESFHSRDECIPLQRGSAGYETYSPLYSEDAATAELNKIIHRMYEFTPLWEDSLPEVGFLRRQHRWTVCGPHALLRSLVDKGRASTTDGLHAFLYERVPLDNFKIILSFL